MKRKWTTCGGFTLVELLVVIGIISVLIAILLPALAKAKQTASALSCLSNLKQLATGIQFYANEFDGWCTPSSQRTTNQPLMGAWVIVAPGPPVVVDVPWMQSAASYFVKKYNTTPGGAAIWNCPDGANPLGLTPGPAGIHGNFGMNPEIGGAGNEFVSQPRSAWKIKRLSRVSQPADKYLIFDAGTYTVSQAEANTPTGGSGYRQYLPGRNPNGALMYTSSAIYGPLYTNDANKGRHPGPTINLVYADLHGERLPPAEVATNVRGWTIP